MIQGVYGVKKFQVNLPKITNKIREIGGHYLITRRDEPVFVTIPFSDYQEIEDILLELNSPGLQKDVARARKEYREGKTKDIGEFLKELD